MNKPSVFIRWPMPDGVTGNKRCPVRLSATQFVGHFRGGLRPSEVTRRINSQWFRTSACLVRDTSAVTQLRVCGNCGTHIGLAGYSGYFGYSGYLGCLVCLLYKGCSEGSRGNSAFVAERNNFLKLFSGARRRSVKTMPSCAEFAFGRPIEQPSIHEKGIN